MEKLSDYEGAHVGFPASGTASGKSEKKLFLNEVYAVDSVKQCVSVNWSVSGSSSLQHEEKFPTEKLSLEGKLFYIFFRNEKRCNFVYLSNKFYILFQKLTSCLVLCVKNFASRVSKKSTND